jgi:diguanylate cyclase (GGDEF)-like protein/PAS domain S-box-containing protein
MDRPFRVLIIEDSEDDALLLLRELRQGGFDLISERVDTPEAMNAALDRQTWDLILADHAMPQFSATAALELLHKKGLDLPFIIVSGNIAEEVVASALKAGAHNCIGKGNLSRLVPIVEHALGDVEKRKQLRRTEEELRKLYRAIEQSSSMILITDVTGSIEYVNPVFTQTTGYTQEEIIGKNPRFLKSGKTPPERYKQLWYTITSGGVWRGEFINKKKNGELYWESASIAPVKNSKGEITHFVAVKEDITELVRMREELRSMALIDDLTGLYNRRGFFTLAQHQLELANRARKGLLLLFADLDGMKWINDTLGHLEGDRALKEAAGILKDTFRRSDIIARIGGDEFAVLAMEEREDNAESVAVRLQKSLEAHNARLNYGQKYKLSLSLGVAYYDPQSPCSLDALMAKADTLMYAQKQARRNPWHP